MFMNANLFEPGKSKPERSFIQAAAKQNTRFDGRKSNEFRDVELTFGIDWGTAAVTIGQTKVLAQVSCDIGSPTSARPNEGTLYLNVDINGVSFLDEVQTTHDQRFLTLNSLLERTFRSSRCLDQESLCVAAEQHVWCVRVDINVLNHDGNLYDASTIAALAALMHFRRPDVSFIDEQIRTYSEKERELVPLLFLHYPVSVTYCVYKSHSQPVVDPTLLEENAADSVIVLSFNSYSELCTLNAGGSAPTNVRVIMQCARNAARRSKLLVTFIRKALALDVERRQSKQSAGLLDLMNSTAPKLSFDRLMADEQMDETLPIPPSAAQGEVVASCQERAATPPKSEPKPEPAAPKDDATWLPVPEVEVHKLSLQETKGKKGKNTPKGGKGNQKRQSKPTQSDSEEETKPVI